MAHGDGAQLLMPGRRGGFLVYIVKLLHSCILVFVLVLSYSAKFYSSSSRLLSVPKNSVDFFQEKKVIKPHACMVDRVQQTSRFGKIPSFALFLMRPISDSSRTRSIDDCPSYHRFLGEVTGGTHPPPHRNTLEMSHKAFADFATILTFRIVCIMGTRLRARHINSFIHTYIYMYVCM